MTLDEAKTSAKEGVLGAVNDYINEQLPTSTLIHALTWRVNALADGAVPSPETDTLIQTIMNFVVTLQSVAQPIFALINSAQTVDEVWGIVAGFNVRVVPPPALDSMSFYSTKLTRRPADPT